MYVYHDLNHLLLAVHGNGAVQEMHVHYFNPEKIVNILKELGIPYAIRNR